MKVNGEGPDGRQDLLCLEGKRAPWVRVSATLSVWGRLGLAVHALVVERVGLLYILRESRARTVSGMSYVLKAVWDVLCKW